MGKDIPKTDALRNILVLSAYTTVTETALPVVLGVAVGAKVIVCRFESFIKGEAMVLKYESTALWLALGFTAA